MVQSHGHRAPLRPELLERIRLVTHRYIRRNLKRVSELDSLRMARRLENLVPPGSQGPVTRAILQAIVVEVASFHRLPTRA